MAAVFLPMLPTFSPTVTSESMSTRQESYTFYVMFLLWCETLRTVRPPPFSMRLSSSPIFTLLSRLLCPLSCLPACAHLVRRAFNVTDGRK